MTTKEVHEMFKRDWKDYPFTYHKRDNGVDYTSCFFNNRKRNIKFLIELRIVNDHLMLHFCFGLISDFKKAIYYVNEFNQHSVPCLKGYIYTTPKGNYFDMSYLIGVKDLHDVSHRFLQIMSEIVDDTVFKHLKPLCDLLVDQNKLSEMA